jgi:tetratricopeptide (TPR) repeat protein
MSRVLPIVLLLLAGPAVGALAQSPADEAARLISAYHEDPTRIDRARELLERAITRDRPVEAIITLSRVYLLTGDIRAGTTEERLAAYDRGRELGKLAVELAPRSEDAHFWYVANTGRWGQTKGVVRSLFLLPTVREELDILFQLNPKSPRTLNVSANVLFEVPGLLGGDRKKAEEQWKRALALDPHYTIVRVDYAKALIATGRYDEARRELGRVLDEKAPTNRADWTMRDVPRAKSLLESIRDRR